MYFASAAAPQTEAGLAMARWRRGWSVAGDARASETAAGFEPSGCCAGGALRSLRMQGRAGSCSSCDTFFMADAVMASDAGSSRTQSTPLAAPLGVSGIGGGALGRITRRGLMPSSVCDSSVIESECRLVEVSRLPAEDERETVVMDTLSATVRCVASEHNGVNCWLCMNGGRAASVSTQSTRVCTTAGGVRHGAPASGGAWERRDGRVSEGRSRRHRKGDDAWRPAFGVRRPTVSTFILRNSVRANCWRVNDFRIEYSRGPTLASVLAAARGCRRSVAVK